RFPPYYISFLLVGLASTWLLAMRPDLYVLAFWALSVVGESLTQGITEVEVSFGGLTINPFGLLNGILPLFYVATYFLRASRPHWIPLRWHLVAPAAWATIGFCIAVFDHSGLRIWVTILNWIAAYLIFVEGAWKRANPQRIALFGGAVIAILALGVIWAGL